VVCRFGRIGNVFGSSECCRLCVIRCLCLNRCICWIVSVVCLVVSVRIVVLLRLKCCGNSELMCSVLIVCLLIWSGMLSSEVIVLFSGCLCVCFLLVMGLLVFSMLVVKLFFGII